MSYSDEVHNRLESAWHCISQQDWRTAKSILQSVLVIDPHRKAKSFAVAATLLGFVLLKLDDPKQALAALDEAMQINSDIPGLRSILGVALLRVGDEWSAIDVFEEAIQRDPTLVPLYYNLGNLHMRKGNLEKSEEAYRAALDIDHNHTSTLTNLGDLLIQDGRMIEAVKLLRAAQEASPSSQEARINLALAFGNGGQWSEAIEQLNWLIRNFSECPRTRVLLARVLRCAGRGQEATPYLDDSIDWGSLNATRYEQLGLINSDAGNTHQALAFYDLAISADPNMTRVRVRIAEHFLKSGEWEQANQAIQQAISINDQRAATWAMAGRIAFEMNVLDKSMDAYETCIALDDELDEPHYWMGRIFLRLNDWRSAVGSLTKLNQMNSPWTARLRPLVKGV
jgi:tetratricopeptide (TPR) repeat protein